MADVPVSAGTCTNRRPGPVAVRWGSLVLAVLLPPGLNLLAFALLWALVLRSLGRAGIGLAAAMTLAALTLHLVVYASL